MSEWKGTLELNEPLSVEIMAKITDAEYENTERLLITTPSGKKVEFIKADAFKWIPVSENPPKESGRYLAYIVNEYDDKLHYIMTCEYSANGHHWHWFPDDECASDNVVAWMPLPKPYKAESEE